MTSSASSSPDAAGHPAIVIPDLQLLDADHQPGKPVSGVDRFERAQGSLEIQAALLALLLPGRSQRAQKAWEAECGTGPELQPLREFGQELSPFHRLPWFDTLLTRMKAQPLADRQALIASTRKIMGARGAVRAIDRLHWLVMRRRLGETPVASMRAPAARDLLHLPDKDVAAIATYSAFLALLVPDAAADATPAALAPGHAWYAAVMAPWSARFVIPPCETPGSEVLAQALKELQVLPWMQRPSLVRCWVTAALPLSTAGKLSVATADALRLTCTLLDSPMPPELARQFGPDPDVRSS